MIIKRDMVPASQDKFISLLIFPLFLIIYFSWLGGWQNYGWPNSISSLILVFARQFETYFASLVVSGSKEVSWASDWVQLLFKKLLNGFILSKLIFTLQCHSLIKSLFLFETFVKLLKAVFLFAHLYFVSLECEFTLVLQIAWTLD